MKKKKNKQPKIICYQCEKRVLAIDSCSVSMDFLKREVCFDCYETLTQRRAAATARALLKECLSFDLDWDLKERIAFNLDTNGDYL